MNELLQAYLDLQWLRPASALLDTITAQHVAPHAVCGFDIELGCGDGSFQFILLGGRFAESYDRYGIGRKPVSGSIVRKAARHGIGLGLDRDVVGLRECRYLHLYERLVQFDGNRRLPLRDASCERVFSNMLYWLDNLAFSILELGRVTKPGGTVIICLPAPEFRTYCFVPELNKEHPWLTSLDCDRFVCYRQYPQRDELTQLANAAGFVVEDYKRFWSRLAMRIWDIDLRPLQPFLTTLADAVPAETRRQVKRDWCAYLRPILNGILMDEHKSDEPGAMQLFVLRRR